MFRHEIPRLNLHRYIADFVPYYISPWYASKMVWKQSRHIKRNQVVSGPF